MLTSNWWNLCWGKCSTAYILVTYSRSSVEKQELFLRILGPVVRSIISLTISLKGQLLQCFITLLQNTSDIFVEKMRFSLFFKRYWHTFEI